MIYMQAPGSLNVLILYVEKFKDCQKPKCLAKSKVRSLCSTVDKRVIRRNHILLIDELYFVDVREYCQRELFSFSRE